MSNTIYKTLICTKCDKEFTIDKRIIKFDCCDTNKRPYFYIIQEKSTGKYYAGSKYAKNADYTNLLTEFGYKTSSNTILNLIKENGINSFIIRKIRIFDNQTDAYEYETRFLKKVKASTNITFYNMHENNWSLNSFKDICMQLYGVDHNMKSQEVQNKRINTIIKKYGSFSNMMNVTNGNINARYVYSNKYKKGTIEYEELRKKIEKTNMEKYGYTNIFKVPEVIKNIHIKGNKTKKEKNLPIINEKLDKLKKSNIDFNKYGWVNEASKILEITPQKVGDWIERNDPEFYSTCYQRNKFVGPPKPNSDQLREIEKYYKLKLIKETIDFTQKGWTKEASKIIGVKTNRVRSWIKKHDIEFFKIIKEKEAN